MSPVYNEAGHLERTARAPSPRRSAAPTAGSSWTTARATTRWRSRARWERELRLRDGARGAGRGRRRAPTVWLWPREARAFNFGLRQAGWQEFTHIGKLDGDVELPPQWFATLLERFRAEPRARARRRAPERALAATDGSSIPIPDSHIHGAVKLYRRECLEAIGGIPERLAWDTIDETYARMRGYDTRSLPELVARHHRHWGSADGRLRGRARHGECAWILHQSLPWALLRSLKLARVPPVGLSGAAFIYGYVRAAVRRTPQVDDPQFRRFVRRELRERMRGPVVAALPRRAVES